MSKYCKGGKQKTHSNYIANQFSALSSKLAKMILIKPPAFA